jgi:CRISPR-associated protein Cas6
VHPLVPAATLDSRLVAIKLTAAPRTRNEQLGRDALDIPSFVGRYTAEIKRQLGALGIVGSFELCGRRSVMVDGRHVVGYSVRVLGLSADQSIALQEKGLGGKRRMGCGVFRKTRGL